jgi:hypothetical protein
MRAVALVAMGACATKPLPPMHAYEQTPGVNVAIVGPGPGTAVVTFSYGSATKVLDGPFIVTAINPGSHLELAVAVTTGCDDPRLAWVGYSGGGFAVAKGQALCARSVSGDATVTQGFSGHD